MIEFDSDTGVITELLDRFNHLHYPRVCDIKSRLDDGKLLQQADIDFLIRVIASSQNMRGLVERNPEYKPLVAKISHFYYEIIEEAVQNESSYNQP